MEREVADTSDLHRTYLDTSAWSDLYRHPQRETIIEAFDRKTHAVFPSVVNVAQAVKSRSDEVRAGICGVMNCMLQKVHALLDHPDAVLERAARGFRDGEKSLLLGEGKAAVFFRRIMAEPPGISEEDRLDILAWLDAMVEDTQKIRRELREGLKGTGFLSRAEDVPFRPDFAELLYAKVPFVRRAVASPEDLFALIANTSAWAAFAASVAYEFHLQRYELSPEERRKPPDGPDVRHSRISVSSISSCCGTQGSAGQRDGFET